MQSAQQDDIPARDIASRRSQAVKRQSGKKPPHEPDGTGFTVSFANPQRDTGAGARRSCNASSPGTADSRKTRP
jgi:hypothetical protein